MRVALYARNSKPPKGWKPSVAGEEPPGSWRTQLQALRAWAQREGHEVALEAHDLASGGNPNRPGWARVMAAARGHHVHAIAAVKLDRCARSVGHFAQIGAELVELKVDLVFLDQPAASVRRGDAMSKAFRGMASVFAELELDLARERSAAVLEQREGRWYGSRSEKPAGRPRKYGEGHKLRRRAGDRLEHDRARCPACRAEMRGNPGSLPPSGEAPVPAGVGIPDGFPASPPTAP